MSSTDTGSKIVARYDDIEEEDNHLPNWWLFILFGTIIFAFGYWMVFHTTKSMPNPPAEYADEVKQLKAKRAEELAKNPTSDEALWELSKNAAAVEEGKAVFGTICMACHGPTGAGLVGPNLTDKFWIHGNKPSDIIKTVENGWPEKGMPPQGIVLGPDKTRKVVAFVLTLRNKNLPGKEPQGDPLE